MSVGPGPLAGNDEMTDRTRTVGIIGGGVAGLAAGLRLVQHGVRVHLFEARAKLGGSCATTTISGYTFNDGALYLALPRLLDHVFAQLGLDRSKLLPLVRITAPQTTYLPNQARVVFGNGRDVSLVGADGRRTQVDLSRLIERWDPVLRIFAEKLAVMPFSPASFLRHAWRVLPRLRGTVAHELDRLFPDEVVRSAMGGMLLYTGLPAERTPALQMLGLVCLFTEGFFVPADGMGQIPQCLAATLTSSGATLNVGRSVMRIRTRSGRVAALELEGGDTTPVDAVISTVSGMHTARLLGEAAPGRMRRKARRAPLSHRAVAVQLGLRDRIDVSSHSVSVLPWMREQEQYFQQTVSDLRYFHFSVPTVTLPQLAPAGASVVEMFPPIRQEVPLEAWDEEAVASVADAAIAALDRLHRVHIAVKRVIGPLQYRDDLRLFDGAVYGLSPAADIWALFPRATAIAGLFQAGQTTYPGYGVVSAAMSGLFAADALLRDRV
jgi:phytoene dehydrogenase-like protein